MDLAASCRTTLRRESDTNQQEQWMHRCANQHQICAPTTNGARAPCIDQLHLLQTPNFRAQCLCMTSSQNARIAQNPGCMHFAPYGDLHEPLNCSLPGSSMLAPDQGFRNRTLLVESTTEMLPRGAPATTNRQYGVPLPAVLRQ